MMSCLRLYKAIIQLREMSKSACVLAVKYSRKVDNMCHTKKYFHFLPMSVLVLSLLLMGCSKDEILNQKLEMHIRLIV